MSHPYHSNDPDFDELTEEEFLALEEWLNSEDLSCKCTGDFCVC
jgi:hypothetical protein